MNKKEKKPKESVSVREGFINIDTVASSTDCTGLIPTPPASDSEAESYSELHKIPKPVKNKDSGIQHP